MSKIEYAHLTVPPGIASVFNWFSRAQVEYTDLYIKIYIAYNAWYGAVTGCTNDRAAITALKKRFVIWDDYYSGKSMHQLEFYIQCIVELTQRAPLYSSNMHWKGEVRGSDDWRGLIEYWYQVRCLLVHGESVGHEYVHLAYESLYIFMAEVVRRIRGRLDTGERRLPGHSAAPAVWEVDMVTASA